MQICAKFHQIIKEIITISWIFIKHQCSFEISNLIGRKFLKEISLKILRAARFKMIFPLGNQG